MPNPSTDPLSDPLSTSSFDRNFNSNKQGAGEFADKLLRGEISAIAAYEQVIKKFADLSDAPIATLRRICVDHEDSCKQLKQVIVEENVKTSEDAGAWGGFVKTFVGIAGLFGEHGALRALKTGEEHGLTQYEAFLKLNISTWERNMIQNVLIPKQKEHCSLLEGLLVQH